MLLYWPEKLTPLCHPIRSQTRKTNRDLLVHVFPRFSTAACISVVTGSLDYLRHLRLVRVTTLVLVLRQLIVNRVMIVLLLENHPKMSHETASSPQCISMTISWTAGM